MNNDVSNRRLDRAEAEKDKRVTADRIDEANKIATGKRELAVIAKKQKEKASAAETTMIANKQKEKASAAETTMIDTTVGSRPETAAST